MYSSMVVALGLKAIHLTLKSFELGKGKVAGATFSRELFSTSSLD